MNQSTDEHGRLGLTTVVIGPSLRADLLEHARACHGTECCGLLLGGLQDRRAVVQLVKHTPNVHPGHRARRYQIDSNLVIRALFDARQGGPILLGFYHSHPDGSIQPSLADARTAWPGMIYLIVGQAARVRPRLGAWQFSTRTGRFEPLSILEPCTQPAPTLSPGAATCGALAADLPPAVVDTLALDH